MRQQPLEKCATLLVCLLVVLLGSCGHVSPVPARTPAPSRKVLVRTERASSSVTGRYPPQSHNEGDLRAQFHSARPLRVLKGKASYYGKALAGRPTASGQPFDPDAFSAAHRSLPFGTVLRVVREGKGSDVYVRVNDRGPFGDRRRILDLSLAAARQLDMLRAGVASVRVEVLTR